jgi:hypothetical protein
LSKFLKSIDFPNLNLQSGLFSLTTDSNHPKLPSSNFERNHFRGIYSNASQIISLFQLLNSTSVKQSVPPGFTTPSSQSLIALLVAGEGFEPPTFGL